MKRPSAPYGRWLNVTGSKVKKIRLRKGGQVDLVIQPGSKKRNPKKKRRSTKKARRSSARVRRASVNKRRYARAARWRKAAKRKK